MHTLVGVIIIEQAWINNCAINGLFFASMISYMYLVLEARKRYANLADHDQNRTSQKSKKNSWSIFHATIYKPFPGSNFSSHFKEEEVESASKECIGAINDPSSQNDGFSATKMSLGLGLGAVWLRFSEAAKRAIEAVSSASPVPSPSLFLTLQCWKYLSSSSLSCFDGLWDKNRTRVFFFFFMDSEIENIDR